MAMDEEACWLHVQLLADVLADLDQVGAALAALARRRLVAVFDARQFRGQTLATCARARALEWRLARQFLFDRRQVHVDRLVEQQALLAGERLAGLAESHAAVVGQLVRQRADLEVLLGQRGITPCQRRVTLLERGLLLGEQRLHLDQQGWVDVGAGKFVEQVHAQQFTGHRSRSPAKQFTSSQSPLCRCRRRQALPVHARHQPLPLLGAHLPAGLVGPRPDELAAMEPAQAHPDAGAVPAHQLETGAAPVGKHVGRAVARRAPQRLLHVQRKAIDSRAHVDRRRRQPDLLG
jgi:hypothetical protein